MKIPIVDDRLNKITMYRLTLYCLLIIAGFAVLFAFLGFLTYSPWDILIDLTGIIAITYAANYVFAKIFKATTNFESVFITALILLLIIPPAFPRNFLFLLAAGVGAMAIKYLPTIDKRHIFNPAAASVAAIALISADHSATWWVGTPVLFPVVLICGIVIVRKIRREGMVSVFLLSYLVIISVFSFLHSANLDSVIHGIKISFLSTPLIFFSTVMLVEPLTSPYRKSLQYWYGLLVAFFYATPQMRLLGFALTPELALSVGNIFSYVVNPKYRLVLTLKEKINVAQNTMLFNFGGVSNFSFIPGQYLEWTLPQHHMDSRGNRRYFSIASSPSEELKIAVRLYDKPSSFKRTLASMNPGDKIVASSLAGDFVMHANTEPVVFMAGGIGIAPFRSIVQDIIDKKIQANIIIFYSNKTVSEIAFADLFQKAEANGVKIIYSLTDEKSLPANWTGEVGHFNAEMIRKYVPDYSSRRFYISGPQPMVQSIEKVLKNVPIRKDNIITDYFPGY